MALLDNPLKPNRPDVVDENFEGEAVLVNLNTGCYFALSPAGTQLWSLIGDGRSATSLAAATGADPEVVEGFLAQLVEEELLVAAETDAGPTEAAALEGAPTLEKFTDMQALLMLDPIHDIDLDGDGWPVAPTA